MAIRNDQGKVLVFILVCCILLLQSVDAAWSAPSSGADKVVNEKTKQELRSRVLGSEAPAIDPEYRIGYGDILSVSIYGEGSMAAGDAAAQPMAEKSKQAGDQARGRGHGIEVRVDGRISLQHLGDVPVVGMTLPQLSEYLQQLYKSVYGAPLMTVTLVQSNSRRYTVMGQVASPGLYYLDSPLTMVQALAKAGGFTEWAKHTITIIRGQKTGGAGAQASRTFTFDYDDFLKGKNVMDNISLQPDDIMIVH